ncbi:hypothetical protein D3C73_921450 [compost metagenome]
MVASIHSGKQNSLTEYAPSIRVVVAQYGTDMCLVTLTEAPYTYSSADSLYDSANSTFCPTMVAMKFCNPYRLNLVPSTGMILREPSE